jgi:hypothetical protein
VTGEETEREREKERTVYKKTKSEVG